LIDLLAGDVDLETRKGEPAEVLLHPVRKVVGLLVWTRC
jgi:hypothetical protein